MAETAFFVWRRRNGAILHVIIFVADLKNKNVCGDYREAMAGLLKEIVIFAAIKTFHVWTSGTRRNAPP